MATTRLGLGGFPRAALAESTNISANTAQISFTGHKATVQAVININAKTAQVSITAHKATVNAETNISAKTAQISFAGQKATVSAETSVSANAAQISLTAYKSTVVGTSPNVGISAKTAAIIFAAHQATVVATAPTVAADPGGGKPKQRRKYPRWVMIDGERYRVNSYAEELALLKRLSDEEEKRQAKLKGQEKTLSVKKVARMSNRIKREQELRLETLRREDEEILLII